MRPKFGCLTSSTHFVPVANINERSMLGDRDSEMCVVFEDTVMIDGVMNGEPYHVGQFCHSLRCRLFRYVRLGNLLKYRKLRSASTGTSISIFQYQSHT